ncbi:MAG TPA: hypothetical protein VEX57_07905, partial [Microlunatus sp.]|nr:hypothetical protein [Microlunatus sp.]
MTVSVPAGADAVSFVATGGSGGTSASSGSAGGHGAQVAGYALVKGTDTITLDVGQQGSDGISPKTGGGGWDNGSDGGASGATASTTYGSGGGGGGATTVTIDAKTVAVAGGGGGAGGDGYGSGTDSYQIGGGDGGSAGATAAAGQAGDPYYASHGPAGGAGGAQSSADGGTGSGGSTTKLPGGVNGPGGGGGAGVAGGAGGTAGATSTKGSGGGGGGARTSTASTDVHGPMITTGKSAGNGTVEIMWLNGFHLNLTASVSTVTASSTSVGFTITGTDLDDNPLGDVSDFVTLTSSIPSDVITSAGVEMTDAGGPHTITATWTGDPSVTASTTVMVNAGSPSMIVIEGSPGSMPAGIPLQLGAALTDEFGNQIADDTSKATWSSDVASDEWSTNQITMTQPGDHKITATVPGYPAATTTIDITAG